MKLTKEQKDLALKLTPLQQKFINYFIKPNMTKRQAYLKAGGLAKTDESQRAAAYKMFTNVHVKEYYDSLCAKAEEQAVTSKADALTILDEIMKDGEISPQHRVGAIKQMSTMEGWDAPKKLEAKGVFGIGEVEGPEVAAALGDILNKL